MGLLTRYRFPKREGSCKSRCSHCKPAFFTQSGESCALPVWISKAAPTPTMSLVSSLGRYSAIKRSCLGVLRPTQKKSGPDVQTLDSNSPLSDLYRGRTRGWYVRT